MRAYISKKLKPVQKKIQSYIPPQAFTNTWGRRGTIAASTVVVDVLAQCAAHWLLSNNCTDLSFQNGLLHAAGLSAGYRLGEWLVEKPHETIE